MKDSGVPWLGVVPEHWDMERAKWVFRKMDRPVRDTDEVVTCFRDGTVTLRKNRRVRGFTESLKEIGYQGIRRGDLVIHAMDAFAGAIGVADADGKGTPVYSVCEPASTANAHFYAYAVREMARSQWIQALAKGIRERSTDFRFEGFGSQPVPLPPLSEQAAIVRFLDHADRRIRRYVRAKQKLIKLLEEQKQAIIHRAVTRGLDPGVRLKPSGVEWLGDVPEHWEVVPLRWYIVIGSGDFIPTDKVTDSPGVENCLPVIGGNGVMGYGTSFNSQGVTIVIGRVGALCGNVHLVDGQSWVTDNALKITQMKAFEPRYLALQLRTMNLNRLANANAQPLITGGIVKEQRAVMPPLVEQSEIVELVGQATADIEVAIDRTQREISLLREYRTRLIADVVTGKLDVREAARLPDEAEEPEPFDETDTLTEAEDAPADDLDASPEEAEA